MQIRSITTEGNAETKTEVGLRIYVLESISLVKESQGKVLPKTSFKPKQQRQNTFVKWDARAAQ